MLGGEVYRRRRDSARRDGDNDLDDPRRRMLADGGIDSPGEWARTRRVHKSFDAAKRELSTQLRGPLMVGVRAAKAARMPLLSSHGQSLVPVVSGCTDTPTACSSSPGQGRSVSRPDARGGSSMDSRGRLSHVTACFPGVGPASFARMDVPARKYP